MERKKLVYNAIQDIWKIASSDFANKTGADMTDDDWTKLVTAIDSSRKKYHDVGPVEDAFYGKMSMALLDLIEQECKETQ
ncbi:hypothetical protein [Butyrivibrio sp. AC2005]|uniref:hypothetical protein n=1 Tax=Butyrivibrio sp. AC2005 TaxID=1280672 RepID=UPI0003FC851A|nr:hypothetical protein [Butyrivibrio sp. AC2005]